MKPLAQRGVLRQIPGVAPWLIPPAEDWERKSASPTSGRLFTPLALLAAVLIAAGALSLLMLRYPERAPLLVGLQGALLVFALALVALVLYRIRYYLMQPLAHLRNWAHRMRGGNLSARIPVPSGGEFADLARDINSLGEVIKTLSNDLDAQVLKQTERIAQKTRSLEVLYDVAASINVSRDLEDLLSRFLHTMKDVVGAEAASVRLLNDSGQMRLVTSVGLEIRNEQDNVVAVDRCLCGTAVAGGDILFQEDVRRCGLMAGAALPAEQMEMIVVPLQYRGSTLGVYNLFVRKPGRFAREDVKELLTSIGRHLGMAIEKAHMEDEAKHMTIMQERTTLAHELHDSLAQTLASLRFQVRVLDETLQRSGEFTAIQEIEQIEGSLDEAYAELRELIAHFRAPLDGRGLVPAIEGLVTRFRSQSGISTFLQTSGMENAVLPANVEIHVVRIVQEALANIRKHSKAKTVRVMLRCDQDGNYVVLVEDDGVGIGAPLLEEANRGEHIGLSIMRERARNLGGELRIESEPDEGTCIELTFRYRKADGTLLPLTPR